MQKARPIWQELPISSKRIMVGLLDLKSRHKLRCCSRDDRYLVDSCPTAIDYLKIGKPQNSTSSIVSTRNEPPSKCLSYSDQEIVDSLQSLVKAPNSKVRHLDVVGDFGLSQLLSHKSLDFPKIQEIEFLVTSESDPCRWKFLELCDPVHLKSIKFRFHLTKGELEKIMETEQWRKAKRLEVVGIEMGMTDQFLNADKFRFTIDNVTGAEVWELIKKYLTCDLPHGCGFDIKTRKLINLQNILKGFEVPTRNQPIRERNYSINDHTQQFILNQEKVFVVNIGSKRIEGVVCRTAHLTDDFDSHHFVKLENSVQEICNKFF